MLDAIDIALEKIKNMGIETENINLENFQRKAYLQLLSLLGTDEVPLELEYVLADMIAGFYLQENIAKSTGIGSLKSIKEGDISLSYSPSESADLVSKLTKPSEEVLARYRRIVW